MRPVLSVLAAILLAAALPRPAEGREAVTACDRLASHPDDPDRTGPGVPQERMDMPRAVTACTADLAAAPGTPRLAYQLSRALMLSGKPDAALPKLEQSAAGGYRHARFVLGLLLISGKGVAADPCRAASLWRDAAQAGHLLAEISFAATVLDGGFGRCGLEVPETEVRGYIAHARDQAKGTRLEQEVEELSQALEGDE